MLSAESLSKRYGKTEALKDISFHVSEGEIFGIVGPDGAGKTSLLRILATLLLPNRGKLIMDGTDAFKDFRKLRPRLGYMPARFSLYPDLTVEENLKLFASVFGADIKDSYHLIQEMYDPLKPFAHRPAGKLSGGMKQKLSLSCALIHRPRILLLDEPSTGIDPISRRELWDMLLSLQGQGICILVSTPNMDEAGRCDRIALMKEGSFLRIDSPRGIREGYSSSLVAVRSASMFRLLSDLRSVPEIQSCYAFGDAHHVSYLPDALDPERLRKLLKAKGHQGLEIHPIEAGIEDCFMELS